MAATARSTGYQGANRRRWSRYPVIQAVGANLVSGETRTACRVEDVSLAGARVRFETSVPEAVLFHLEGPDGMCIPGRRAWAGPASMGIAFKLSELSVAFALALIRQEAARNGDASEEKAAL